MIVNFYLIIKKLNLPFNSKKFKFSTDINKCFMGNLLMGLNYKVKDNMDVAVSVKKNLAKENS